MTLCDLPAESEDVLEIPVDDIPLVMGNLIQTRRLSALVNVLHKELASPDDALRNRSEAALQRLGFPV